MTRIVFYLNSDGDYSGFRAYGHAQEVEQNEYSMVCAAVSVLTFTTVNALERVAGLLPAVVKKDGYLDCRIAPTNDSRWQSSQVVLGTLKTGIEGLLAEYPKYISYHEEEV